MSNLMAVMTAIKALTPVTGQIPDDLFSLSRVIQKSGVAFGLEWVYEILDVRDPAEAIERMLEAGATQEDLDEAIAEIAARGPESSDA